MAFTQEARPTIGPHSEALGQLGQDEPASGMALEPLDGLCPISGSDGGQAREEGEAGGSERRRCGYLGCRRWSSNPSGKCSSERPTRGTVGGTMRSMRGADAGCLAINYQSLYLGSRGN